MSESKTLNPTYYFSLVCFFLTLWNTLLFIEMTPDKITAAVMLVSHLQSRNLHGPLQDRTRTTVVSLGWSVTPYSSLRHGWRQGGHPLGQDCLAQLMCREESPGTSQNVLLFHGVFLNFSHSTPNKTHLVLCCRNLIHCSLFS